MLGDSIHNFCDGIIIAAAFLADTRLGVVTALAIIAHEIPQEVGDYIVLLNAGFSRARALLFNAALGTGGGARRHPRLLRRRPVAGGCFPYLLVVAASSFIYVAVADLIPQLQHRLTLKETRRSCSGWWPASAWSCWRPSDAARRASLTTRVRSLRALVVRLDGSGRWGARLRSCPPKASGMGRPPQRSKEEKAATGCLRGT